MATSLFLKAQSLTGLVMNQDGEPLPEAYIIIKESERHAHSNVVGYFVISDIKAGEKISITYLGYENLEYQVKSEDLNGTKTFTLKSQPYQLGQVYVDNSVNSVNQISRIDLQANPVNSSQEILRKVPGLFIGQHAGGGKAEQIFLRGFDIDHGTDVALSMDGMPVNMVSHAHGQGYSDLHFIIPEVIKDIDFSKGPYHASQGNFATAGYVNFQTKDRLENSTIGLEVGQFNTARLSGALNVLSNKKSSAYIATEFISSDGPFESPQNFNRMNVMGKWTGQYDDKNKVSLTLSRFQSKWDASGQIPVRAVESGQITRFGAIDDTEGGQTSRTNAIIAHTHQIDQTSFVKSSVYYSQYEFELFSNFTFYLEDPENGDQIRQYERRNLYGVNSSYFKSLNLGQVETEIEVGVGLRYDDVNDNELAHTVGRRTTLERLAYGDIDETNAHAFVNAEFNVGKFMINPGIRLDAFKFDYHDRLITSYTSLSETVGFLSPKLNLIYNPNRHWQLYVKTGRGFHSNDTRVVVAQGGEEILPAAYGADLGAVWKPLPGLWLNAAAWYLYLEQEFVYVGDAGIVEPSGETTRQGVDIGLRLEVMNDLFFDTDFTYTKARSVEGEEGENLIPLAPEITATGGLSYQSKNGISAALRYRFLGDRPANEDNSIVAEGYLVLDANASYSFRNGLSLGVAVENLLDTEWNEAQFATESRLEGELESVEEIHFTPGVPFFIKGIVRYSF